MESTLPQELIDLIIDELGAQAQQGNYRARSALRACAQTSWSLLSSARKFLFARIRITQHPGYMEDYFSKMTLDKARLDGLLEILTCDPSRRSSSPLLTSHIRSLELILSPTQAYRRIVTLREPKFVKLRSQQNQGQWNTLNSSLPAILKLLSHVQSFSLKFPLKAPPCRWSLLDQTTKSAILDFCESTSLTALEFGCIEGLPLVPIIVNCSNLQSLVLDSLELELREEKHQSTWSALSNIFRSPHPDNVLSLRGPFPAVKSLSLEGSGIVPLALLQNRLGPDLPTTIFSTLDCLELSLSREYENFLADKWKLMFCVSSSLKTLRISGIRTWYAQDFQAGPIRLNIFRQLRSLELTFTPAFPADGVVVFAHWQSRTLFSPDSASTSDSLETLTMSMHWNHFYHYQTPRSFSPEIERQWLHFDSSCVAPGSFPSLKTVRINLSVEYWLNVADEDELPTTSSTMEVSVADRLQAEIIRLLPALSTSTTVQLEVKITPSIRVIYVPRRPDFLLEPPDFDRFRFNDGIGGGNG